ncbi:MAG: exodeoxyribonuclease V subunit alpha [Desulfurivibrio sp.]|nr:exodeoxyribonuclease V subunit alpha [Desulfurivibrio sp.]MBU4118780.1 exodeoxyribonuclease V subunit alpha [Pseudomonadota bacterium]
MIREIEQLIASGMLDQFDRYFVRTLQRLAPSASPRTLVLAALTRKAVSNGHVCLDLKHLVDSSLPPGGGGLGRGGNTDEPGNSQLNPLPSPLSSAVTATKEGESSPSLAELTAELRQSPLVSHDGALAPLVLEGYRLYLQRYWRYEEELVRHIQARVAFPKDVREDVLASCLATLFTGTAQDGQQREACAGIFRERLGLITGGPGTGKTTLVTKYLSLLLLYAREAQEPLPRILLLAPTGKAAARLTESLQSKSAESMSADLRASLPTKAATIHRALGYRAENPTTFRHNRENPLLCDVVVVDEASMIDVALMAKLFEAVPPEARLVLLGDKDQLASVEAGSIMGDICGAAMGDVDGSAETPLARCVVRLTESFRYSPHEGIGALASAIHAGKPEEAVALAQQGSVEVSLLPPLVQGDPTHPLAEMILAGYRSFLDAVDPLAALKLFEQFRLLCAHRTGPMGVSTLNRYAEKILSLNRLIEPNTQWYRGRPVLIQANSYPLRLFNGETGIIWPAENGEGLQAFFFSENREGVRSYSLRQLPAHETAFAMTIHKSQGSEFDRVGLILPGEDLALLSRELLYTGISRARSQVALVGRPQEIEAAVGRRVERASGLGGKLTDLHASFC